MPEDGSLTNSQLNERLSRRELLRKGGAVGVAAIGLSAGAAPAWARVATSASRRFMRAAQSLDLAIAAGLDTSPLWAALDNGFFTQHSLDVTPHTFLTGTQLVSSIVSGQSDVTPIGVAVHYAAVSNGVPLKIIGIEHGYPVRKYYSTNYVVAGPRLGARAGQVAKLRGAKVGLPLGTDGQAGLAAVLGTVGLTTDDVQMVNLSPPDMATALQTGAVDAISFVEPWPSLVLSQVSGSVRLSLPAPIFSPGILVSTADTIASKRSALVQFLAAAAQAEQWARHHRAQLIAVNSRHTTIPADVANTALNRIRFDPRMSKLTLAHLAYTTIPTLRRLGVITKPVDPRVAVDASLNKEVQVKFPQFFSDLPKIPRKYQL